MSYFTECILELFKRVPQICLPRHGNQYYLIKNIGLCYTIPKLLSCDQRKAIDHKVYGHSSIKVPNVTLDNNFGFKTQKLFCKILLYGGNDVETHEQDQSEEIYTSSSLQARFGGLDK